MKSPPYTIFIVEFWGPDLSGYNYRSNRIFSEYCKCKKYLTSNGYIFLDENTYTKNGIRAIITERTVE
jgi:hypothetical protein